MDRPLGRGTMFQIYLATIEPLVFALKAVKWPLYEEPQER